MSLLLRNAHTRSLYRRLHEASSYPEWLDAALESDQLLRLDQWRQRERSRLYGSVELRARYELLRGLLDAGRTHDLLYALNEGIHGNLCGMGKAVLYNRALSGTKVLIDEYVNVVVESLTFVAAAGDAEIPHAEKLDFFRRASHCYGRSALMLSGGAGLIYFHHGVVQTLVDNDMLPHVLSGASAGSWLCAQIGTLTDEEMKAGYFDRFRYDLPTHLNPFRVLAGLEQEATPLSVKEGAIDSFCNDMTFQEAYEHTGRYINISIAPAERHQAARLMNAITSPNVYIRSAVDASSSVPGIVPPVTLYAKGVDGKPKPYLPSQKWVDGSFADDLPAKRLARLFGVNHYLVSLINPLAVPFVTDTKSLRGKRLRDIATGLTMNLVKDVLLTGERISSRYGATFASPLILMAHSLLDQEYTGDINIILPQQDFRWVNVLFGYHGDDEIGQMIHAGKRATWPKLAQVRNATLIARTLDGIIEQLDGAPMATPPGKARRHLTLSA
ncbi:MAG: patatin-like phospholipase family protein [Alcanivoracaceae bacterium]